MNEMDWANNTGIDPKVLQLDPMSEIEQVIQRISSFEDSFNDIDPGLRYLPNFGKPHSDVMRSLTGPDAVAQSDHVDLPVQFQTFPYKSTPMCHGGGNSHNREQAYGLDARDPQSFGLFSGADMHNYNEPSNSFSWLPTGQESTMGISSATNYFTSSKPSPVKLKTAAKMPQVPSSRNRKNRTRRTIQRSSSPVQNKHAQIAKPQLLTDLAIMSSSQVTQSGLTVMGESNPQQAIALLEAIFRGFSRFQRLKGADLMSQVKQLVDDENKYGKLSQSESSEINPTSTASSTQNISSHTDMGDSESISVVSSVSSTPRQPSKNDEDDADPVSAGDTNVVGRHELCRQCEDKALFQCTWKDCGYSTHSFTDYQRHESSDKHWPQKRFMCLECTDQTPPTSSVGPNCTSCHISFSALGGNIPIQYLQSRLRCQSARKEIATFSRKDHLIDHLRKDHKMSDMNTTINAWTYSVAGRWPRQCGFCGINFQTWDERMNHLKEHFENGDEISTYKRPFPKSMDFRPSGFTFSKDDEDDDDDDQDDNFGGNRGSLTKAFGRQRTKTSIQSDGNLARGGITQEPSKNLRYRESQESQSFDGNLIIDSKSLKTRISSIPLQRYLEDPNELARLESGKTLTPDLDKSTDTVKQVDKSTSTLKKLEKSKDSVKNKVHDILQLRRLDIGQSLIRRSFQSFQGSELLALFPDHFAGKSPSVVEEWIQRCEDSGAGVRAPPAQSGTTVSETETRGKRQVHEDIL